MEEQKLKNLKRNLVIAVVLLFVCAAVYLNWSYNKKWGEADSEMVAAQDKNREAAGLTGDEVIADAENKDDESSAANTNDYFALARLTRQTSRDEALGLLQMAATSEGASQEVIDSAMNEISVMAGWSMREAQLENLLLAKDFAECVVFINGSDVTVAVPAPEEGLSEPAVARINDTLAVEAGYAAAQRHIIPVR
jgi:stage III sporulation protein AH